MGSYVPPPDSASHDYLSTTTSGACLDDWFTYNYDGYCTPFDNGRDEGVAIHADPSSCAQACDDTPVFLWGPYAGAPWNNGPYCYCSNVGWEGNCDDPYHMQKPCSGSSCSGLSTYLFHTLPIKLTGVTTEEKKRCYDGCSSKGNSIGIDEDLNCFCVTGNTCGTEGFRNIPNSDLNATTYTYTFPTQAPTTQTPTTQAPTTQAPTTQAPTTQAPTTQAPTTHAPTTQAPTTQAPTTQAPTTQAPTTIITSTTTSKSQICMDRSIYVTIKNDNGNKYFFNDENVVNYNYKLGIGTYTLTDIPSIHSLYFPTKPDGLRIVGNYSVNSTNAIGYYNTTRIIVDSDFGEAQLECINHQQMGINKFTFDERCSVQTTTIESSTTTVEPSTPTWVFPTIFGGIVILLIVIVIVVSFTVGTKCCDSKKREKRKDYTPVKTGTLEVDKDLYKV